jgi:hypothetical protein
MPPHSGFGSLGITPLQRVKNIPVVLHDRLRLAFGDER